MRGSIWIAVMVTVAVLWAAGSIPPGAVEGVLRRAPELLERLAKLRDAFALTGVLPSHHRWAWGVGAAAAMMIVSSLAGLALRGRRNGPRGAVLKLAHRGCPTATIARRCRLAQDGVRLLLHPDPLGPRRRLSRSGTPGSFFRSEGFSGRGAVRRGGREQGAIAPEALGSAARPKVRAARGLLPGSEGRVVLPLT